MFLDCLIPEIVAEHREALLEPTMFWGGRSATLAARERMAAIRGSIAVAKKSSPCRLAFHWHQLGTATRLRADQITDGKAPHGAPVFFVVDPQRVAAMYVASLGMLLRLRLMIAMRHTPTIAGMSDTIPRIARMNQDLKRFVSLRDQMAKIRDEIVQTDRTMTPTQRDIVALAQAEALCDIAASLNAGLTISTD